VVALLVLSAYSITLSQICTYSASVYVVIRIEEAVMFVVFVVFVVFVMFAGVSFSCFLAVLALEGESCNLFMQVIYPDDLITAKRQSLKPYAC
jgi:hypothetical protein